MFYKLKHKKAFQLERFSFAPIFIEHRRTTMLLPKKRAISDCIYNSVVPTSILLPKKNEHLKYCVHFFYLFHFFHLICLETFLTYSVVFIFLL